MRRFPVLLGCSIGLVSFVFGLWSSGLGTAGVNKNQNLFGDLHFCFIPLKLF